MTTPALTLAALLAALSAGHAQTAARPARAAARGVDWASVDSAIGRPGAEQPGGVRRFGFPRGDLRVTVRDVAVRPALALGSWVAFLPMARGGAVAMGDLVLREEEMAGVMSALQAHGIEQSAVHHHLLYESPRIVYMHIHAHGDPVKIARGVRAAVALTGTPPAAPAQAGAADAPLEMDTAAVRRSLGHGGRVNGGVYQVSVPRAETIRSGGMVIPPSMGLATAINFQPTGGGRAAITGDFVMTAGEVNRVIRALREHEIEVTSLHNHLLDDSPRLFFMHFWANADAVTLARGLRAALDRTNSKKPDAVR